MLLTLIPHHLSCPTADVLQLPWAQLRTPRAAKITAMLLVPHSDYKTRPAFPNTSMHVKHELHNDCNTYNYILFIMYN